MAITGEVRWFTSVDSCVQTEPWRHHVRYRNRTAPYTSLLRILSSFHSHTYVLRNLTHTSVAVTTRNVLPTGLSVLISEDRQAGCLPAASLFFYTVASNVSLTNRIVLAAQKHSLTPSSIPKRNNWANRLVQFRTAHTPTGRTLLRCAENPIRNDSNGARLVLIYRNNEPIPTREAAAVFVLCVLFARVTGLGGQQAAWLG